MFHGHAAGVLCFYSAVLIHALTAPEVEVVERGKIVNGTTIGVKTTFFVPAKQQSHWLIEGPYVLREIAIPLPARENQGQPLVWYAKAGEEHTFDLGFFKIEDLSADSPKGAIPVTIIYRAIKPT